MQKLKNINKKLLILEQTLEQLRAEKILFDAERKSDLKEVIKVMYLKCSK